MENGNQIHQSRATIVTYHHHLPPKWRIPTLLARTAVKFCHWKSECRIILGIPDDKFLTWISLMMLWRELFYFFHYTHGARINFLVTQFVKTLTRSRSFSLTFFLVFFCGQHWGETSYASTRMVVGRSSYDWRVLYLCELCED